jgi:lysophospholipase L1-like esterase
MKAALALLALLLTSGQVSEDEGRAEPLVGGRAVAEPDGSFRFGWPGVYFEGRFRGPAVTVKADGDEPLRVLLDGRLAGVLTPGSGTLRLASGGSREHVVRLEKMAESQTGSVRFLGFFVDGVALPPVARARQIEFVGDSYTVGYGNLSATRTCSADEIRSRTDSGRAFGPLAAARLGADYRLIAYSGRGIVRNYAGSSPGEPLPRLYPRVIPGEAAAMAAEPGWRPQVIVVNLGTNDFSTPLASGEAWADEAALRRDYRLRYVAFVRMLQQRHPQARLVLMAGKSFAEEVAAVARETGAMPLRFGELERTGCDWHPSQRDHQALARLVERSIAPLF